jgi:serine/threonine protein kinase
MLWLCLAQTTIHVVLELAPFGALTEVLYDYETIEEIPGSLAVAWLCDMADALQYIHSKQVKHRDIKAENFLVFSMFRIKLCDFGLAKEHHSYSSKSSGGTGGTLAFMAPEVKNSKGAVYASDIFSFAMTAVQVLTRNPPHGSRSCVDQVEAAVEADTIVKEADRLVDLLLDCVKEDPTSRPKADEVHRRCMEILRINGSDPRTVGNAGYKKVREMSRATDDKIEERRLVERAANSGVTTTDASASDVSQTTVAIISTVSQQSMKSDDSKTSTVQMHNIARLKQDLAVELLIDLGCIDSLHEKIAEKGEYIDGDVLTVLTVEVLKLLEDASSTTRIMKLATVINKLKEIINVGISQETMDRLSKSYEERQKKKTDCKSKEAGKFIN